MPNASFMANHWQATPNTQRHPCKETLRTWSSQVHVRAWWRLSCEQQDSTDGFLAHLPPGPCRSLTWAILVAFRIGVWYVRLGSALRKSSTVAVTRLWSAGLSASLLGRQWQPVHMNACLRLNYNNGPRRRTEHSVRSLLSAT